MLLLLTYDFIITVLLLLLGFIVPFTLSDQPTASNPRSVVVRAVWAMSTNTTVRGLLWSFHPVMVAASYYRFILLNYKLLSSKPTSEYRKKVVNSTVLYSMLHCYYITTHSVLIIILQRRMVPLLLQRSHLLVLLRILYLLHAPRWRGSS